MTALASQIATPGAPAPGLQQRQYSPTLIGAGAITITNSAAANTTTIAVGTLGLIAGGQQTTSFNVASNTSYSAEGSGIVATGPAAPATNDVIAIAVGSTAITFNPNSLKVNGQTSNITLLPFNTYIMTYLGSTSGWC